MLAIVPSDGLPNGLAALRQLLTAADSVSVACAFVTNAGVDRLEDALEGHRPQLEICARGAPITEPSALLRLRDELDATVTAVGGPRAAAYHPKLWLLRSHTTLTVLSGSGNVTGGGLTSNIEQFELLRMPRSSDEAVKHEHRLSDWGRTHSPRSPAESGRCT